jgi:hypothetical protein
VSAARRWLTMLAALDTADRSVPDRRRGVDRPNGASAFSA